MNVIYWFVLLAAALTGMVLMGVLPAKHPLQYLALVLYVGSCILGPATYPFSWRPRLSRAAGFTILATTLAVWISAMYLFGIHAPYVNGAFAIACWVELTALFPPLH